MCISGVLSKNCRFLKLPSSRSNHWDINSKMPGGIHEGRSIGRCRAILAGIPYFDSIAAQPSSPINAMRLSIRWKVTLAILLAVTCGLSMAGILAIRSLEQQEIAQLNDVLEARTKLVEYGLQPVLQSPASRPTTSQLNAVVRDLGSRASARITLIARDGMVLADSAVL